MTKAVVFFLFLFTSSLAAFSQTSEEACAHLRKGVFYFNAPHNGQHYKITREDTIQQEIKLGTNDTSYWKIQWQGNCTFVVNFLRKTVPISDRELEARKSHAVVSRITSITSTYYTFELHMEPSIGGEIFSDTMWLIPKN